MTSPNYTALLLRQLYEKHPDISHQEIAKRADVKDHMVSYWRQGFGMRFASAVRVARAFDLDLNALKGARE